VEAVWADLRYQRIRELRKPLTHSRLLRHFRFHLNSGRTSLELQLSSSTRISPSEAVALAKEATTQHLSDLLTILAELFPGSDS
jgi:hypothetical protein